MLKVPKLDDLTYEQMIQRAVSRIPAMTDEWTDFNSHDPGITVLQTYAWLVDMLNYYMNATGDIHIKKYLKLLGIEPVPEKASEAYVVLEGRDDHLIIPAGTRFFAGSIPFETTEDSEYSYNRFCSCINEVDGAAIDLTAFAGKDGDFARVFSECFEREAVLYLGFEHALKEKDRLYVNIKKNTKRNPFGMNFELCRLQWQYCTADGWQELKVEDATCGFLRTGFVTVYPEREQVPCRLLEGGENAYYIRCILKDDHYDVLPGIGMICVNPLKTVQQYTVCRGEDLQAGPKLGKTDGCAGQELEFDYPDIYHFDLVLWDPGQQEAGIREIWKYTDMLDQAAYTDRVFAWDEENKRIRFGDGLHGAVPARGLVVSVANLTCSYLAGGNVLPGEINRSDSPLFAGFKVRNPEASFGGRDRESVHDMLERMEETLLAQNRMASAEDYEERILKTPGLMLDLVHVMPGKVYGRLHGHSGSVNEVVAVVKPYGNDPKPVLNDAYRNMIGRYVEPYRLINTKVSIVSCEYVGIEVHGRIRLDCDAADIQGAIRRCLEEEIDYREKKKPFGMTVSYGRLFTKLEALEGVRQVQSLSLERIGNAAEKNDSGDILIHEDALGILERIDLEYC